MPTSFTEGVQLDDVIANEWDKNYSRKAFVAEGAITKGSVIKDGTSPSTQKTVVAAAGTGANSIALNDAANGEPVMCLVRGPVVVKRNGLTYGSGATGPQKTTTDGLLAAASIVVSTASA